MTVGTKVTSISRSKFPTTITLPKGAAYPAKVKILPTNANNQSIKWTTSNSKVATVSTNGTITAKANGGVKITATSTDGTQKSKTCTVTVVTKISSISVKNPRQKVALGDTYDYNINFNPSTVSCTILVWRSSDTSIASVTSKGVVKGLSEGTTVISATATDGSQKSTSFRVTIQKLSYKDGKFIAHRGLSSVRPENTKPAFNLASDYNFYGIETDIWESIIPRQEEEGTQNDIYDLMCMHDPTTGRMCNASVPIQNINKENREAYPVTKGNGNSYSNLLIPTLDEYLEAVGSKAPIIEIKESSISDRAVQAIIEALREKEIQNAIIITFHKDSMSKMLKARESEEAKGENPVTFKVMYLKSAASVNSESISAAIEYCKNNKINIIGLDKALVTNSVVKDAHQNGVKVSAYTVDDPSDALYYIDMGVDYLTTNQKLFLD